MNYGVIANCNNFRSKLLETADSQLRLKIPNSSAHQSGNFFAVISSSRKDEIGILTGEFIKMMDTIKNINGSLEDLVDERTKELKLSREDTILRLATAAEKRDTDTGNHIKRTGKYSKLLAMKCGLDKSESEIIGQASLLHDVGKIGIIDQILRKSEKLTPEEFEIMKTHTSIGAKILKIVIPYF